MRQILRLSVLMILLVVIACPSLYAQHPAEIHLQELFEYTGDRFVQSSNGVITDRKTKLQWFIVSAKSDDRKEWNKWDQSNDWANNLTVDGGKWRLPHDKEINSLLPEAFFSKYSKIFSFKGPVYYLWTRRENPRNSDSALGFSFKACEDKMYESWMQKSMPLPHKMAVRAMPKK